MALLGGVKAVNPQNWWRQPLEKKRIQNKKGGKSFWAGRKVSNSERTSPTSTVVLPPRTLAPSSQLLDPTSVCPWCILKGTQTQCKANWTGLPHWEEAKELHLTKLHGDHWRHLEKQVNMITGIQEHLFERGGEENNENHHNAYVAPSQWFKAKQLHFNCVLITLFYKNFNYQPFIYWILHLKAKEQSEIEAALTGKTNKSLAGN